ncbi:MAG: hypothetical protein WA734_04255 [Candidatus Acidiferrales bacterium]
MEKHRPNNSAQQFHRRNFEIRATKNNFSLKFSTVVLKSLWKSRSSLHKTTRETNRLCVLHHDRANASVFSEARGRTMHSRAREETPSSFKNTLAENS